MSDSAARKAVYFSTEEKGLKRYAESQPGGFSTYIKRLILADLNRSAQRSAIMETMHEYFSGQPGQDALARALARALDGKHVVQSPDEGDQVSVAADLELDEIEQITSFMTGR